MLTGEHDADFEQKGMNDMITRSTILALSLAFCTAPAFAAPETDQATASVRIDDLNLASAQGRQRLDKRIDSAVRLMCRAGGRTLADRALETQCIDSALADAKPQTERAIAQAQGGGTMLALLMVKAGR